MTQAADAALAQARALLGTGRAADAQPLLERLCREQDAPAEAWFLLGAARHMLGQLAAALAAFERASQLDPGHAQALNARASMLSLLGRPAEALAVYEAALARDPGDARIVVNAAIVLEQLGQPLPALERYARALDLDPACLPALLNRSALLMRLGRNDEAWADADRAAAAHPASVDAHYNRAEALLALDRYEQALLAAGKVVALAPGHVGGHMCRALALACLGQIEEARETLLHARALDPEAFRSIVQAAWRAAPGGRGGWEYGSDDIPDPRAIYLVRGVSRLARCDWAGRETFLARFEQLIRDGVARADPVCEWSLPFATLALPLAPDVVAGVITAVARRVAVTAPRPLPPAAPRRGPGEPLRVGILSASFRRHPSAYLNAPVLACYDRARVQASAYVLNPADDSRQAAWLAAGCVAVHDCHAWTDEAIARRIRDDGIHLLVDIDLGLDMSRPEVLRLRPAPINVAYLGGLLPAGGDWIDYRVIDRTIAGDDARTIWTEQLVLLGRTPFTYATGPIAPAPVPSRAEAGLPAQGVVLCCFNGAYKIDPVMFDAWMRVLAQAPGSVLWLLGEGEVARKLRAEARARGVAPQRLVFAPHLPIEAHLARQRLADLFLDTLPCNAHTTAAEALHCGVPVLTLSGDTPAGRCAASIVTAAGLPELVTASLADYEALAVRLATDAAELAAVKARLEAARATSPLWDARDLAARLERAFEIMWARHTAGLAPESFEVCTSGSDQPTPGSDRPNPLFWRDCPPDKPFVRS